MIPREIKENIYSISVNDRSTALFEGIWPVEREGVSYNSYLINDEKTAVIDLVKGIKADEFFSYIDKITPIEEIDYVIINHMEPDHTGAVQSLARINKKMTIICTAKGKQMLEDFYGITERVKVVEDGETLNLGKVTLRFIHTPYVHWPETMMTYAEEERILFPTDGFGSFGHLEGGIFDDEYTSTAFYEQEALRYYVNIVATFSLPVLKAIDKLADLPIDVVAPAHGLIWRTRPGRIIELYRKWAGYHKGDCEKEITLVYSSMYGSNETLMEAVSQGVRSMGVPVKVFNPGTEHPSYILPALWKSKGVILGVPTYEGGIFPPMAYLLDLAEKKQIFHKEAVFFGGHGWSGGALAKVKIKLENLKWNLGDTLEFKGGAGKGDLERAFEFGREFAGKIKG